MLVGIADRKYYIIFRKYDPKKIPLSWRVIFWIVNWGRKDFAHVDLAYVNAHGGVSTVTCAPWQIGLSEHEMSMDNYLNIAKSQGCAMCIAFDSITKGDTYVGRSFIYCVTVVKAILGVRGWRIYNGYRLHKKLIKLGGQILWASKQQY